MIIYKAINFACQKHKNQVRKSNGIPFVSHLMEITYILTKYNCSENVIAAGILHDVLEDTPTTEQELLENFGPEITELVNSNSEDKSKSWKERKQHTINQIAYLSPEKMQLLCADKISNVTSLIDEVTQQGEKVWQVFNASKQDSLWYYTTIYETLKLHMQPNDMLNYYGEVINQLLKINNN